MNLSAPGETKPGCTIKLPGFYVEINSDSTIAPGADSLL